MPKKWEAILKTRNLRRQKFGLLTTMPITREYGRRLLKQNGYEFFEAANGRIALEIVEQNRPDLIVADVMTPDIDGLEFLKTLRAKEEICEISVIRQKL